MNSNDSTPGNTELAALRALADRFPNADAAFAEIARLNGELTLPKGAIHVVSDVHGEDVKLRHVINNASGTLRPVVEKLFANRAPAERQELLTLIFYPREQLDRRVPELKTPEERHAFSRRTLEDLFTLVRNLAATHSLHHISRLLSSEYSGVLRELLYAPAAAPGNFADAIVESLVRAERDLHVIRLVVRLVRDLAVDELIVAGDCYDRGPRADRVVEYLKRQPNVSFAWGNHDVAWIGAGLGQEALIAHVLRVSIRYRRLSQLEEGYGITMQPLEHLVRTVYADDKAECFKPKGEGLRDPLMMARMQKAAAIMQFKLEGQAIARNPGWKLDHRGLLRKLDPKAGTVEIDGKTWPLKDTFFPTFDPAAPEALSAEEQKCMERLRRSFLASDRLWQHMRFLVDRGAMWQLRDDHLIFHGCVPVDDEGRFLAMTVDGTPRAGKELFSALERVVVRSLGTRQESDIDLLWYLWSGPLSPLFGKDRITTLENDLVADKATHVETKNAYFKLIHEVPFCDRILAEFGVSPERGLIINGHVPVKIDKGESPMKRSGKAITIDGAFSQAYGDHGYTLVMEADRTFLAMHHHFDSVEAAVRDGVDIIPTTTPVRESTTPRRVGETEQGVEIRADIALLESLVEAYRSHALRERSSESTA
jgi:fructose-1,6-bisphosphatase-3